MEDYKCIKKDTLFKKTLHITLHYKMAFARA